jgi:Domain of unknown function (DUF4116)
MGNFTQNTDISIYYKLLRASWNHHGFQYKPGLNIAPKSTERPHTGLYLCRFHDIPRWIHIYEDIEYIAEARLGKTSNVIYFKHKIMTDCFFMRYPTFLWKFLQDRFNKYALILGNPFTLKYLRYTQDDVMCLDAISANPHALQYVACQSIELCMEAVKRNGLTIRHIRRDYIAPEICMAAVKQNGLALAYIHNINKLTSKSRYIQSEYDELCMTAVKQNGLAIKYVPHQTREICLAAIHQNPYALQFVKEQTIELCYQALIGSAEVAHLVLPAFRGVLEGAISLRAGRKLIWPKALTIH